MGTLLFAIASLGVLVAMVKVHADVRVSACSWHRRKARVAAAAYLPPVTQSYPWSIVVPISEDDEMASVVHGFEHSEC